MMYTLKYGESFNAKTDKHALKPCYRLDFKMVCKLEQIYH